MSRGCLGLGTRGIACRSTSSGPRGREAAEPVNQDFRDVLSALLRAGARFLVVGAHAMAAHGVPRATGALDVWVDPAPENAERVWQALLDFGASVATLPVAKRDLEIPGQVVQMGVPPQRIDILTGVTGVDFETAWSERIVHRVDTLDLPFIGREALLRNKRATGRAKDLADVEILDRQTDGA